MLSDSSQYFIVWLIEPIETNRVAIGYDIGSETAARLPAITRAVATLQPTVTARLKLVQSTFNEYGLLYLLPLHIYETLAYQQQCLNFTYELNTPTLDRVLNASRLASLPRPSTCGFDTMTSSSSNAYPHPWSNRTESARSYGPDYVFGMVSAVLKPSILLQVWFETSSKMF